MKVLNPSQPLKVVHKLFHKNCSIGTEGTLDVYLCEREKGSNPTHAILLVFTARYEDFGLSSVTVPPQDKEESEKDLGLILNEFARLYESSCMEERNKCKQLC